MTTTILVGVAVAVALVAGIVVYVLWLRPEDGYEPPPTTLSSLPEPEPLPGDPWPAPLRRKQAKRKARKR